MGNQRATVVLPSTSRTVDGQSAPILLAKVDWAKTNGPRPQAELVLLLNVTAITGTSPTLDVSIEWGMDGVAGAIPEPAQAFAQILEATGPHVAVFPVLGDEYRIDWAITGATPDYTFSVRELVR